MYCHAEIIRAFKNKTSRAAIAGVLASFVVAMPVMAQNPLADFEAGKFYHDGDGVPKDYARARSLYERAAEQGNADAMINLGYMYYVGQGVAQDYDIARDWYIRAERQGSPVARVNLDGLYARGLSGPPDISELGNLEVKSKPVVSGATAIETPMLEAGPETNLEPDVPSMTSSIPSVIHKDEDGALKPPPDTLPRAITQAPSMPTVLSDAPLLSSEIPSAEIVTVPKTHDRLVEAQNSARPSFSIARLIPFLIWFAVLLCLLGIIGFVRFMMSGPRRFAESFMRAHDYGLRRMYNNFLQTARTASNREIWLRGVSDMMVRYAHDEDVAAAHMKQARPLQEAAKDSQEAARLASASLARRAEKLIVKSYGRLGAPD